VVHAQTGNVSESALVDLIQQRHWEAANTLLDEGRLSADQLEQSQGDGMTALHWAVFHGHVPTLEKLIALGLDPDEATEYGARPLLLASENSSVEVVDRLLEAGADIDGRGAVKETALMLASRRGEIKIVERLIQADATIDLRERNGNTALMWAAAAGHADVVRKLIEAGADVSLSLNSDFTAFLFSAREGHLAVAEVFLENGVDVNAIMEPKNSKALSIGIEFGESRCRSKRPTQWLRSAACNHLGAES